MIFLAAAAAVLCLIFLSIALFKERTFNTLVFAAFASFNFNLSGFDFGDVAIPVLLVVGLVYGYVRPRNRPYPGALMFLVILLLLWMAVADLLSDPMLPGVGHIVSSILAFTFVQTYLVSARRARVILGGLLTGMTVAAVMATLARRGLWTAPEIFFDPARDPRFMGMSGDPNMVAFLAMFLAVWLIDEIIRPKLWRGGRALKLLVLLVALFEVAASLSRASWLGLGLSLMAYGFVLAVKGYFHTLLRMGLYVVLAATVAAVVATSLGYADKLLTRLSYSRTVAHDAEEGRRANFYFTRRALAVADEHPIIGTGTGRTERLLATDAGSLGAHNTYVQMLVDHGTPAFLLFLAVLLWVGVAAARRAVAFPSIAVYGISTEMLFAAVVGLGAASMFHDVLFWRLATLAPAVTVAVLWPARRHFARAPVVRHDTPQVSAA